MDTIERVGVVGVGLMGSGIAEVCARNGIDVVACESDAEAAERGRARVLKSLDRGVGAGNLDDRRPVSDEQLTRAVTKQRSAAERRHAPEVEVDS